MRSRPLVVLVVTHRRPMEMKRLLGSLRESTRPPEECVISDHAPDGSTQALARASGLRVQVLEDTTNPGPGAGWANAAAARSYPDADLLFLDDDVVLPPHAIEEMAKLLSSADCVAPLLEDSHGSLWAFPEPVERTLQKTIRRARTPADAAEAIGLEPHRFCWCTGACVLITSELYSKIGPHRRDFWMLGEDLEFSMRAASAGRAIFTCGVHVPHLPPAGPANPLAERIKFCSLLQNLCYLSLHSPHSRHMRRYLPGNFRRYFRTFGWNRRALSETWACFFHGAIKAQPAGGPLGTQFRARMKAGAA